MFPDIILYPIGLGFFGGFGILGGVTTLFCRYYFVNNVPVYCGLAVVAGGFLLVRPGFVKDDFKLSKRFKTSHGVLFGLSIMWNSFLMGAIILSPYGFDLYNLTIGPIYGSLKTSVENFITPIKESVKLGFQQIHKLN